MWALTKPWFVEVDSFCAYLGVAAARRGVSANFNNYAQHLQDYALSQVEQEVRQALNRLRRWKSV